MRWKVIVYLARYAVLRRLETIYTSLLADLSMLRPMLLIWEVFSYAAITTRKLLGRYDIRQTYT